MEGTWPWQGQTLGAVAEGSGTATDAQERRVFRWVNGKNPRQYGFDFGLWTRQIVRELIAQRFGVTLSLASVGALLARVGLTPQKPLQRAYQRDPEAITRWQRETYPAVARQAKRDGADIYFWDESGFRADAVHGKTWGAKGQTPEVNLIAKTTTAKGLKVTCRLDRRKDPTGRKVSNEEMKRVNLKPNKFHGEWNYVIDPRTT
jgi:hypothetical protein